MLSAMPDAITLLNAALEGRDPIRCELGDGGMATVYVHHPHILPLCRPEPQRDDS